ncbi:MAG: glycosyltransferase [Siculibacillus sp.]|nr:glycosyltransferase [Siculibacillus sp.]
MFLGIGVLRAALAEAVVDPPVAPPPNDADLPRFAVLVPLFREAEVVGDLVAALLRLDYPVDRLDLRLVVEADDLATRAAADAAVAGTPVEVLAVPAAEPRTKPKALNFALACVDAPFVSVFDAEDRPDPDQLRKAAAAFHAGGPDLAVVQAALEIDHADGARPWSVRQFEIEYAVLFHGLLPWLARQGLFLPLGGTSNHFRASHPLLPQENESDFSCVFSTG